MDGDGVRENIDKEKPKIPWLPNIFKDDFKDVETFYDLVETELFVSYKQQVVLNQFVYKFSNKSKFNA